MKRVLRGNGGGNQISWVVLHSCGADLRDAVRAEQGSEQETEPRHALLRGGGSRRPARRGA